MARVGKRIRVLTLPRAAKVLDLKWDRLQAAVDSGKLLAEFEVEKPAGTLSPGVSPEALAAFRDWMVEKYRSKPSPWHQEFARRLRARTIPGLRRQRQPA